MLPLRIEALAGCQARPSFLSAQSMPFYAVARGRAPGVYESWEQCSAQVTGSKGACFKKFNTSAEAQGFIQSNKDPTAPYTAGAAPPSGSVLGKRSRDPTAGTTQQQRRPNAGNPAGRNIPMVQGQQMPVQHHGLQPLQQQPRAPSFYALTNGRHAGVYTTWQQVQPLVQGVYTARYKKFGSREEAEAFIQQFKEARQPQASDPDPQDPSTLVAFCDGSCLNNGRYGCRAGWACVFPHNPELNSGAALAGRVQTNNRAEYSAALEAMRVANQQDPSGALPLFIFSDSQLLIRSMTEWLAGWRESNWVKADGSAVKNRDLLERLVAEQGGRRVVWRFVKAHTGRSDFKSRWNHEVDRLARRHAEGTARAPCAP